MAWLALIVVCLGAVLAFRFEGLPFPTTRAGVWLLALRFFTFAAIHLLLVYERLFRKKRKPLMRWLARVLFGALAITYVLVVLVFLISF